MLLRNIRPCMRHSGCRRRCASLPEADSSRDSNAEAVALTALEPAERRCTSTMMPLKQTCFLFMLHEMQSISYHKGGTR